MDRIAFHFRPGIFLASVRQTAAVQINLAPLPPPARRGPPWNVSRANARGIDQTGPRGLDRPEIMTKMKGCDVQGAPKSEGELNHFDRGRSEWMGHFNVYVKGFRF